MKKLFATALALVMLTVCAASLAEQHTFGTIDVNGVFELRGVLPEGFEVAVESAEGDDVLAVISNPNDTDAPLMMLSVAFDEMYSDVMRLNDLDAAALAEIEATFTEEDQVEITYTETAHGTRLIVARETTESVDYVAFYTIYMGYSVEFDLVAADNGLTEEQIAMAVAFLSDLDFVPVQ